jgi:molybdenum cofactor biosynthesis enzyme
LNISSGYAYLVPTFQPIPVLGDTLNVTAITHKLRYLGVPIAVKYSITSGKLKIEALTGVTVNFLTMGKLETEVQKDPNNEIDLLNKIEGLK